MLAGRFLEKDSFYYKKKLKNIFLELTKIILKYSVIICILYLKVIIMVYGFRRKFLKVSALIMKTKLKYGFLRERALDKTHIGPRIAPF